MEPADSEVVARSLAGEPEAFAALVRRHGQAVHAYLFRRANRQTADELLGEVWLRAFRSRAGYDQDYPNARPWLYGIARNVLRAHWRAREPDHDGELRGGDDPWTEADDRLEAADQFVRLQKALDDLHPADREVLLLVAWEHLTPAEAAASLDIPQGTARWRLHRARILLQRQLYTHPPTPLSLPCTKEA